MEALHTKHRPIGFDTVVGQSHVIKPLQGVLDKGTSQCFIFSGPSGTGKTTLARICAAYLECSDRDIMEVDAATFSGIDKMREVQNLMRYKPIGGGQGRAIIVDEAHGLSRQAWDALLKPTEEPNKNVYWFFATTNPAKIPATLKTRAAHFALKPVSDNDLQKVIDRVMKKEKLSVPEGVQQVIIREAGNSPRQALSNLAMCAECSTAREASALLHAAQESDATIELCRFLLQPGSWLKAMAIFEKLKDESPEGVRIVICNYMGKVLASAKNDKAAMATLGLLECFSNSFNQAEGHAPLLLAIGRAMYSGD
jgi:DNA polymerase III gamma/tau subunit